MSTKTVLAARAEVCCRMLGTIMTVWGEASSLYIRVVVVCGLIKMERNVCVSCKWGLASCKFEKCYFFCTGQNQLTWFI